MRWVYGKNDWRMPEQGEENCYLLTNGLGGYSSLAITGAAARNDQALLMAALKPPTKRYHLVTNVHGEIMMGGKHFDLASQRYVNKTKNQQGQRWLSCFEFEYFPVWHYQAEDLALTETVFMRYGENTVGIRYEVEACRPGELLLTPWLQFAPKGHRLERSQVFAVDESVIISGGVRLRYDTNGQVELLHENIYMDDWFYEQDARDGRDAVGCTVANHRIHCPFDAGRHVFYLVYRVEEPEGGPETEKMSPDLAGMKEAMEPVDLAWVDEAMAAEKRRQQRVMADSGLTGDMARTLVKAADQYLTWRRSTEGWSIMAGFPFFEDWGRDTMIAMAGCTIAARRFEHAKSILKTFMAYCRRGLMPNMFPEGDAKPMYNTVDASLLFIETVYLYLKASGDMAFAREAWPEMTEIVKWYQNGTDYGIRMDEDGLIRAGEDLYQLTWMDVRVGDILPTPRHGKPVEINAYWYNALMILAELAPEMGKLECGKVYERMAKKTKDSFLRLFWDEERGCLRDVAACENPAEEEQLRCNQIWALSLSHVMVDAEKARRILQAVERWLYTPWGLRTLSPGDKAYHGFYGGSQFERDMAYHQGTVWAYPLGAYYRACLRWSEDQMAAMERVKCRLKAMEACLREGCIGHIAEIYDGDEPNTSKGCFAQAWSVGEILRVYAELEEMEGKK